MFTLDEWKQLNYDFYLNFNFEIHNRKNSLTEKKKTRVDNFPAICFLYCNWIKIVFLPCFLCSFSFYYDTYRTHTITYTHVTLVYFTMCTNPILYVVWLHIISLVSMLCVCFPSSFSPLLVFISFCFVLFFCMRSNCQSAWLSIHLLTLCK